MELFVHPAFLPKLPLEIDVGSVTWNLEGIDRLLNLLLDKAEGYAAEDIDSGIAGDIAGDIAGGIADGIARVVPEKMLQVLSSATVPIQRKEILKKVRLINNVKNFNTYLDPLIKINWLTMTIPDKPTSPKQKYLTTLKGHLVLALLQRKNG